MRAPAYALAVVSFLLATATPSAVHAQDCAAPHRLDAVQRGVCRVKAETLDGSDPNAQPRAARNMAVGELAKLGDQAIPGAVALFKDERWQIRLAAVEVLCGIATVPKRATTDDRRDRRHRRKSQAQPKETPPTIPPLLLGLKDKHQSVRASAARCFSPGSSVRGVSKLNAGWWHPSAALVVPALVSALADSDEIVRLGATEALGGVGPEAAAATTPLTKLLNDQNNLNQMAAAEALGKIGEKAAPAIPTLIRALGMNSMHPAVAIALGRIGAQALPSLRRILVMTSTAPEQRILLYRLKSNAIVAFRNMAYIHVLSVAGSKKPPAFQELPDIVSALAAALSDKDNYIRADAANALAMIGPKAKAATSDLERLLKDPDKQVSVAAREALLKINPAE